MREEGHWRRMRRSEALQPMTNSGTCPKLGLASVSVACLTATALGATACLQERSRLCLLYLVGLGRKRKLSLSSAEKTPAYLEGVSTETYFFPPLPPSLITSPSPLQPQLYGLLVGVGGVGEWG